MIHRKDKKCIYAFVILNVNSISESLWAFAIKMLLTIQYWVVETSNRISRKDEWSFWYATVNNTTL